LNTYETMILNSTSLCYLDNQLRQEAYLTFFSTKSVSNIYKRSWQQHFNYYETKRGIWIIKWDRKWRNSKSKKVYWNC